MDQQFLKKRKKKPAKKGEEGQEPQEVQVPEIDAALDEIDKVLAQTEALAAQERESHDCGCWTPD